MPPTHLPYPSELKCHCDLNITSKTAWHLAHRIREALKGNQPT